ncbi:lipopolysaccharide biosynthesis protein [uncultured Microbacterium sp.]|uniref:lipopolysaccharide biosynthesis protein n=1 Tax=uncultured Microbacterium sp. TaxID=191216 RepID=UPI0028D32A97|nr:lipopolysaccharide biosynthesis protein [uncultured Microbacterium sp.]
MTDTQTKRAHLTGLGARNGALTLLAGQWGKYLLQLASFVVLARLIPPEAFGQLAMVTSIVGIATVFNDLGLSLAALQRESLSRAEKSNLFWLNTAVGLVMCGLVAAAAPAIAALYDDPTLAPVCLALSTTFLFGGISAQHRVEINRRNRYSALAAVDLISQLVAFGVAILLAMLSLGVWALVGQAVAASLFSAVLAIGLARWLPGWWSRGTPVRPFLRFGIPTLLVQLVNYVSTNVDNVVVGREFGASSLGIYSRAFQLISLPIQQLVSPLTRVAIPYLAAFAVDRDRSRLQLAAQRVQGILTTTLLGALSLLASLISPVIVILLGREWVEAAPLVQILAVGAAFQCLGYLYYWLFLSVARTKLLLLAELPGRAILIALVCTMWPLGIYAVAWSVVVGQFLVWATGTLFFLRRIGIHWTPLVRVALGPVLVFGLASAACLAVQHLAPAPGPLVLLLLLLGTWLGVVGIMYALIRPFRTQLNWITRFMLKRQKGML